ncbi:hypothetical protein FJT64_001673 [Amphibalanus amphitrite]|uniref:Uncharacterized protein n=1 Tax=Amphibalanus amphitrite TaxID=1232801 RepID=A0A6A4XDA3_AMPAM|nr:hypothetical protein FJT64_001673 [Amphibalanus amphitrite]
MGEPGGRGYGGVAIATRDGLSTAAYRPATPRPQDSRLEAVWSTVTLDRGRRLLIGSIYRPPRYTAAALDADFGDLEAQLQRALLDHPNCCDWSDVFTSETVDGKWRAFLSLYIPVLDKHAPIRSRKVHNPSAPPVTAATKDLMASRRGALRTLGRDSSEYRDLNRSVRSAIRRDTRLAIESRIREQGPHTVWRNIRSVVAGRKRDVTSPQLSPSALNEYFVSVGPRVAAEVAGAAEHAADLPCRLPRVGACGFSVSPIDLDTLTIALHSMRNSPACGSDASTVPVRAIRRKPRWLP